jgi:hypothetical protein
VNALDLDEALQKLTPEVAAALINTAPAGYLDQLRAATRDAIAVTELDLDSPQPTRAVPHSDTPDWLRLGALDALCQWFSGKARTCLHDPRPGQPQPVWACAWKPGLVVCVACRYLLHSPRLDMICDCCGHECQGVEVGDGIFPLALGLSGLMYRAGACRGCMPEFGQAAA